MAQITSMTGPVSSLRAQLRAQAEAALGTETYKTPFTDRLGDAIREVAVAQNSAANLTKSYELGIENDLSKVMVSQQVSSCLLYTSPSPRDKTVSRMPSSA